MANFDITYDDLLNVVAKKLGYGIESDPASPTSWSDADVVELDALVQQGLQEFYWPEGGHEWSFLRPTTTMTLWPTTASTLAGKPAAIASTVSGAHTATKTLTTVGAIFKAGMVGETITIDSVANVITGVTSTTVCTLLTAITESGTEVVTVNASTVTVDDASFYESAIGKDLTIGSHTYEIIDVTSTVICTVTGIATAEVDEAVTTLTADGDYRLPANFGGMIGDMTFSGETLQTIIRITGTGAIDRLRQTNDSTGRPTSAAVVTVLTHDATEQQQWMLTTFPVPDAVYTAKYRFYTAPSQLDSTDKYPLGGATHAATIRQSCLAVAEHEMDDTDGPEVAKFYRMLARSIQMDKKFGSPSVLGYMGDGSDRRDSPAGRASYNVTYEGALYEG